MTSSSGHASGVQAVRAWPGQWVANRLGVRLVTAPDSLPLPELVGLALRRNPRRAHLLVSPVLGKHVPATPSVVAGAGQLLGRAVAALIGDDAEPLVLGYAETATGLGSLVAAELGGVHLNSTRRAVPGVRSALAFEEVHSHATGHDVLAADPSWLAAPRPVVLVDDELSTGATALATVRALHRLAPHPRYVIAALVDVRGPDDRERGDAMATELGRTIDVVSLARGVIEWSGDLAERAAEVLAAAAPDAAAREARGRVRRLDADWPAGVPDGARHGVDAVGLAAMAGAAAGVAAQIAPALSGTGPVLVLGSEELMYAPLLIALVLETDVEVPVLFSTTTRSPVLPVDDPGYAIRTGLVFAAHDDPADPADLTAAPERYAYNVAPAAGAAPYADVVVVVDDVADTDALHADDGLLARLSGVADAVHLVVLPSWRPDGGAS